MNPLINWLLDRLAKNPAVADFFVTAMAMSILLVIAFVVFIYVKAFLEGREISFFPPKIGKKPDIQGDNSHHPNPINMIFENSEAPEFPILFERLFRQADKIVLIGSGFSILHRQTLKPMLFERIRKNIPTEIYAANPFSPNVEARLIEEETGADTPEIRRKGLVDWLLILRDAREKLQDRSKFILRLFPFYPTYALFIFNGKDYFFYPYGYTKLGTLSPVLHFSKDTPAHQVMIQFLDAQAELVKERSAEADLIFKLHENEKVEPSLLTAFAVYLIPPADSPLYKFGSEILEYDVRNPQREFPRSKWHNAIGAAFDFGLHVTVADALYCATKSDLDLICKEVEFLASGFRPFTLNLGFEKDFPNERGIALVCQDKIGSLEAMHHEMVARVYRFAAASNYSPSLGLAQPDRDQNRERAKLMIKRYHAPYILQRFTPHFSLLSDVPPEKKDQYYAEIRKLYEKRVEEPFIEIGHIAVMYRPDAKGHWQILKEYKLGGDS